VAGPTRGEHAASAPEELDHAVSGGDLPLALIDLGDMTVRAISRAFLERLGHNVADVVHRPAIEFVRPEDREMAEAALDVLSRGAVDFYRAHRDLAVPAGAPALSIAWLHGFEIGDHRVALVEVAGDEGTRRSPLADFFGGEPEHMCIGATDADGVVTAMSSDVEGMLDLTPKDFVGRPLISAVARKDGQGLLAAAADGSRDHSVGATINMRTGTGTWRTMCCLFTPMVGEADHWLLLVPEDEHDQAGAQVVKLERHLWRIAGEIEASGVLQRMPPLPDVARFPQVNALSSRQWEVLSRLAQGERIPSIAAALHISQSTARNHLSAIFERFGVHSQAELLRVLRAGRVAEPPSST